MDNRISKWCNVISLVLIVSIDGAPEMIASNIWVAHEFCDSPEISAELSNLWNTIVYEKDELLGQEDVLTAQLKNILEKCQ